MAKQGGRKRWWLRLGVVLLALIPLALWILANEGAGQRLELEGLYRDRNFRDVGASMNACLAAADQPALFQTGQLLRANRLFSGWSCSEVGDPQKIVTWNYRPDRRWEFYCAAESGERRIGFVPTQEFELADFEFMATWEKDADRTAICSGLEQVLTAVGGGDSTLIHCDAGRDRTGSSAAVLAAVAFEQAGRQIDDAFLAALECDYRKSESLKPYKYGRIASWHRSMISDYGGASAFLKDQCQFSDELLQRFSQAMLLEPTGG